jgi:hypothetical protein
MEVSILITENQKRLLLKESLLKDVSEVIKNNYEVASEILKSSKEQMGVNLQFLMTWGASIGGFVGPLTQFVEGNNPELTSTQVTSIMIGVIATFYLDNRETILKIVNRLKEDGLFDVYIKAVSKGKELKRSFVRFIESLNMTLHKVTNMMTYTFIIPLVEKILSMSQSGEITSDDIKQLAMRIASFGLLTVSSITVVTLIKRMVNRFKQEM